MLKTRSCSRAFAPVFALLSVSVLQAGLYSNLGSPAQFDDRNGWQFDGGVAAGQELAVSFKPTQNATLTNAQLALGIIFTNLVQSPINVDVTADASGSPGAVLANLTLGASQTVGPWPPGNVAVYNCTGACPVLRSADSYWLVVSIPDLNPDYFDSQAAWSWNTTLDYSNGTDFAFNDTQFGGGWQFAPSSELRPAFQIDATPTAAPEPASLLLVSSGLYLAFSLHGKLRRSARHTTCASSNQ